MNTGVTENPPLQWSTVPPTEPGWYWVKVKKTRTPMYLSICSWDYLQTWLRCVSRTEMLAWAGPIPEPKEMSDEI